MASPSRLFFDGFELRLDSGELLRDGAPVTTLQPQPARVLGLLAGRSGEVVGREEIRQLVWGESFVDFDASLNFCVKQIRRALGDSATAPRYIETLPRRGYRFLRPVRIEEGTAPPKRWPLLTGIGVTVAALTLLIVLIASRFSATPAHPRLAVFPLHCAAPADPQLCGGVTAALTAELTRRFPKDLEVVASTSPLVYQGTRKSPLDVGRELGATHVMTGTVSIAGGTLQVEARLTTVQGRDLWHDRFEAGLMDAPRIYDRIARKVAGALELRSQPAAEPGFHPSREASEAYLRGVYLLKQWKYDEAVKSLDDAVLLAPRYAPAYAALALARVERGRPAREDAPASRAAAKRALELDPRLPEAHLAMANVLFKDFRDWQRAGAEYRQALVLDPGNADVLRHYAIYLACLGSFDEAIAAVERARELDPASMAVQSDLSWFLYLARRYGDAIREARSTLKLLAITQKTVPPIADYGSNWTYWVLVQGSLRMRDEQTAVDTIKMKMKELKEEAAAERLRSLPEILSWRVQYVARKAPEKSYNMAEVNATVGRLDEALGYLERQCRNGGEGASFNFVAVEPVFDPLHGDPRFARIVDCTGLPRDAPIRRTLGTKQ